MTCELCISSQAQAADSLPTSSLGTPQLSLWSGSPTPAPSSESEPQKDGSPNCKCGRETFGCSTHPNTPAEWTASMRDSLSKIYPLLAERLGLAKEPAAAFTAKSCASLAWFDRASSSWKTYQRSSVEDWEPFSETWPRWGMTLDGVAYELPIVAANTPETDGGLRPTPRAQMGKHGICWSRAENGNHRHQLEDFLAHLYVRAGGRRISGLLIHPSFCESLMRWPTGFTVCTQSETGKTHSKPQQPSCCSPE